MVDIEIVLRENESLRSELASELADELADIFHSPSRGTWVKVRGLPANQYAENGGTPTGVYPVFVAILKSTFPLPGEMPKEVERITGAVAQICNRSSENVHVIYEPEARGRLAFGGKIVS